MKGAATTKAKRKAVLSQLMMEEVVEKYSAAVLATGENESHWTTSSVTTLPSKIVRI